MNTEPKRKRKVNQKHKGEMKESRGRRKRTSGPDTESNSIMKLLPSEIKLNIISRLPFDSVLDCKLVCKSWCKTIENPSFAQIHLRQQLDTGHSDDKVSFLFLPVKEKTRLFYGKYDESSESSMNLKTVNHPIIFQRRRGRTVMVGSCNGLVCFSLPYTNTIRDPICICNPSVGEQISLPRFTVMARNKHNVEFKKTAYLNGYIVSGFGYNSTNDEYKVVRIYYANLWEPKGQVQVYTLGSGSGWRNIEECPYSLRRYTKYGRPEIYIPSRGVLADGALHWLDEGWNIVSFDLVNEKFSLLPSPPCYCPGEKNFFVLQVLADHLCVVNDQNGECLDICSFKKETGEWEKMFGIPCESDKFMDVYWPISLTSSGKLILRYDYRILYCYDPRTREWNLLMKCDTEFLSPPLPYSLIAAIPHINSFISLKALGERCTKIVRALDIDDYDPTLLLFN